MIHELKISPLYFNAILMREKTFEIRKNDRDFHAGDTLILKEWDGEKYTGRTVSRFVNYILYDWQDGMKDGYCIMNLKTSRTKAVSAQSQQVTGKLNSDCISRQAAIDALAKNMPSLTTPDGCGEFDHDIQVTDEAYVDCMQIIHDLPSAQPEPSIPILWIKEQINRLNGVNNGFARLSAMNIEILLEKWMEGENDESVN